MNKVVLMGRLTKNPDIRYTQASPAMCIARYTLAVNRRIRREGEQAADFISCVAFGKAGEFAEKYLVQGTKITVSGRLQTGSYTDREGTRRYTTDVIIEEQEFAESKGSSEKRRAAVDPEPEQAADTYPESAPSVNEEGFMSIPEGIQEELPFI